MNNYMRVILKEGTGLYRVKRGTLLSLDECCEGSGGLRGCCTGGRAGSLERGEWKVCVSAPLSQKHAANGRKTPYLC